MGKRALKIAGVFLIAALLLSSCSLFFSSTITVNNNSWRSATVTIDGISKYVSGYGSKDWTINFGFGENSRYITCQATFSGLSGTLTQYYTIYAGYEYTWNINSSKNLE